MENLPSSNNESKDSTSLNKKLFFQRKRVFYFFGIILCFVLFYFLFFSAPKSFPVGIIINIKDGESLRAVSKDLKTKDMIQSRAIFETLVITLGGEKYIAPGDYLFENRISIFDIAKRFAKGERHLAPIKVTIPEGFNVEDISKVFSDKLPKFNAEKFLAEAIKKEGYLFPDTYFFYTGDTEQNVLNAMNSNFEKKILSIKSEIVSSGKTEKDIIIMASLVEKESKGDIDRDVISGILWHRLLIGMPLQVDSDLYTYKNKGLSLAPICNPGMKSIEAAIHPKVSNYLYYLHDKDGNIHYAKTFEEHKLNKRKYLK